MYLKDMLSDNDINVAFLTETHLTDSFELTQLRQLHNWSILACHRPRSLHPSGNFSIESGGVAIINTNNNPDLRIRDVCKDPAGLLAVTIYSATNSWQPYLAIVLYCPPNNSPFFPCNNNIASTLDSVLQRNTALYGENIIIAGDLNFHYGPINPSGSPRLSDCKRSIPSGHPVHSVLAKYGLAPLAGRNALAHRTSRPLRTNGNAMNETTGAESDYFLMPETRPLATFSTPPPPPWQQLPSDKDFTHRPIYATIELTGCAPSSAPKPTSSIRPPPTITKLFYNDPIACGKIASETLRALDSVRPSIRDASTSAADASKLLINALETAVTTAIPYTDTRRTQGSHLPASNAPSSAAAAARARANYGNPMSRNSRLPPAIVHALQFARSSAKEDIRTSHGISANTRAMQRAAQKLVNDFHAKAATNMARGFNAMRGYSPHDWIMGINKYATEDPTFFGSQPTIPDGPPPHPPAHIRFTSDYGNLFAAKPPPPATNDPYWLRFVRPEPAPVLEAMGRNFTAEEILPCIWSPSIPHMAHHKCNCTGATEPQSCLLCDHMSTLASRYRGEGDPENPPPHHFPRGHAQSAVNSTNSVVQLYHLVWARPDPASSSLTRTEYRLQVASLIADVLNKILAEGKLPADLAVYLSTPLAKATPSSMQVDAADSNNYRFITMAKLLTKLLALAIDARLKHWAVRDGNIVSVDSQGAFTPLISTEWNVIALTECIKAQWRAKKAAYVAFIDFKKAYDSVSPDALIAILRHQGLPSNLLNLLSSWLTLRSTSVRVNGIVSDPLLTAMGVGQGDIHSCILFNIFINSLSNYLKSLGHTLGVSEDGVVMIHFAFADDVAAPSSSPATLQEHIRAIHSWAKAWGMTINVGETKTACMYLPYTRTSSLPPQITLEDGTPVPWVNTYKYLGCKIHYNLNMDSLLDDIIKRLETATARYFAYNSITDQLDQASKSQLLKGTLSPYLLSLVPPTEANIATLDIALRKLARYLTRLPLSYAPNATLDTESGLPSARFLLIRTRFSTLLSLALTPHQSAPAVRAIRGYNGNGAWSTETIALLQSYSAMGAGPFNDIQSILSLNRLPHIADVPRAALVFARKACAAHLLATRPPPPQGLPYFTLASQRLPHGEGPLHHGLSLAFYHAYNDNIGIYTFTPMSCRLPGAAGGALPRLTIPLHPIGLEAIAHLRLGAYALSLHPLGPDRWKVTSPNYVPGRSRNRGFQGRLRAPRLSDAGRSEAARGHPCPFCPNAPPTDPFHVIHECIQPEVIAARNDIRQRALVYIPRLINHIESAANSNPLVPNPPPSGTWDLPLSAVETHNWDTATNGNLLFFLLAVIPWPAAFVDDPNATIMAHLGRCFDAARIDNSRLHAVYNSWAGFGSRATLHIFKSYSGAVNALPAGAALPRT